MVARSVIYLQCHCLEPAARSPSNPHLFWLLCSSSFVRFKIFHSFVGHV
jgi:hypothetical protein